MDGKATVPVKFLVQSGGEKVILRQYQLKAVQSTFNYLAENKGKNPVLVLPTGAGKSICLAAFISSALEWWPGIKILVVTHQKELIEQYGI